VTYEPRGALVDAGQTESIASAARGVLQGALVLEAHEGRAAAIAASLRDLGYTDVAVGADLAGKDRVVEACWTP
jgi:methylase of polypeptide subunit release factors